MLVSSQKHQSEDKKNQIIPKSQYLLPEARKTTLVFFHTKYEFLQPEN